MTMLVWKIIGIFLFVYLLVFTHYFCFSLGDLKGFKEGVELGDECIENIKKIYSDYIDELEEEIRKMQEGE